LLLLLLLLLPGLLLLLLLPGLLLLLLLPGGLLVARGGLLGEGGGGRLRGSRKAQFQKLGTHRSQKIFFHTLPHETHPKIK
jgi:hypothetical protein